MQRAESIPIGLGYLGKQKLQGTGVPIHTPLKFVCFSFFIFANSIASPSGDTPLILSARVGDLEVCQLLISSKADVNARGKEYATHTLLTWFFEIVLPKFVFSFLTFANSIASISGVTPLIDAAAWGNGTNRRLEVCQLLISSKADVNAKDEGYATHTPNFLN
jgi:ankyrin repeat protein